jgi:hypothetical protein
MHVVIRALTGCAPDEWLVASARKLFLVFRSSGFKLAEMGKLMRKSSRGFAPDPSFHAQARNISVAALSAGDS